MKNSYMGDSRNDGNGASHKTFPAIVLGTILLFFMFFSANGQTIYQCDFEDETENLNWTLDNGDETNQWYIGSAASNGGENGLYITNDGGESNEYTATATSYVYAYRTIEVTDSAIYEVSFDWIGYGENNYDLLHAFIIPTSLNPILSAGDANGMTGNTNTIPSGWIDIANINEELNYATTWQHSEKKMTMEAGTYYLVFFWKNNNSNGNNPPAVVDNISIIKETPATMPYTCDFEDEDENAQWTLANLRNKWYIGSAANNGGSNGLYISNDGGESNAYTITSTSYVYAYRTLELTESAIYGVNFDWIANGQSDYDLLRAFMIPVSLNPSLVAGDANGMTDYRNDTPSDWIDITNPTGKLNLASSWQHSEKDVPIEAGTYYLVFFWKNNGSSGNQPPAALDNISIEKSSCMPVTDIRVGDITAESVTISWTEPGAAGSWEVIVSETELDETELANYAEVETVSETPTYTATGLNLSTTYYMYVRSVCDVNDENEWTSYTYTTLQHTPATLPYTCDFEDDAENANWIFPNSDQTNTWHIGTAANNGGSNGLYISDDDGANNEYDTGSWSYSHAYREIYIDQTGKYLFSFDWKAKGRYNYDFLKALVIPANIIPDFTIENIYDYGETPEGWIDISDYGNMSNRTSWQHCSKLIDIDTTGTYYLVFYWRNGDTGDNPPAAIDNVEAKLANTPIVVTNISTPVDANSARLKGSITYGGTAEVTERGFLFGSSEGNLDQTLQSSVVADEFTYTLTGLNIGETFYYQAYATNSEGTGYGSVKSFTVVDPDSYEIIYFCDFEDDAENQNWHADTRIYPLNEEEDIPHWTIGNLANNGGENGLYIYDDAAGTLFSYGSNISYAYREIDIPISGEFWFSFDWQAMGDGGIGDVLRAFIVPTELNPYMTTTVEDEDVNRINGDSNTTPEGWIDISERGCGMSMVESWQKSTKKLEVEAGSYYLVFYWVSDGTSGYPPSGEVDNILIKTALKPYVKISSATNIEGKSVTLNATILDEGVSDLTEAGFLYGLDSTNLNVNLPLADIDNEMVYLLEGLTLNTKYFYQAYATNSKGTAYSEIKSFRTLDHTYEAFYLCDFEDATENANWTLGSDDQTNRWYIGTATNNGGNSSLYISNNEGASYSYNNNSASYSYAYREINLYQTSYQFDFDWKANGEGFLDFMRACVASDISYLPDNLYYDETYGWIELGSNDYMSDQEDWQHISKIVNINTAGTYYLVFYWKNDSSRGEQPPAAIDNIEIKQPSEPNVITSIPTIVSSASARLKANITFSGTAEVTERGFLFGVSEFNLDQTLQSTDLTDEFTYTATGLTTGETYYFRAYATNSNGTGYGIVKSFTVVDPDSYDIIYSCDFEDDTENANWSLNPPTDPDVTFTYWKIDNFVNNGGEKSLYVVCSSDGGIVNEHCGGAYSYAYREIEIPFSGEYWFNFDWRAVGEDDLDYMQAYLVPVELEPNLAATEYDEPNSTDGWILIGDTEIMSGAYTWRTSRKKVAVETGSYYLVFFWESDATESSGLSGAVDNILIRTALRPCVTTASPTNIGTTSATLIGNLMDGGVTEVTERGFVYGNDVNNLNESAQYSGSNDSISCTLTGLTPGKLYYNRTYATNSKGTDYGNIELFQLPAGQFAEHNYVDLGLPSGTIWATANLGATTPEGFGNYYAWGETSQKDFYDYTDNYYYSYSDNPDTLPASADAATANWGNGWRMPTKEELQELVDNCEATWIDVDGLRGMQFTASNGNSIFLPASGHYGEYYYNYDYGKGYYLSSTLGEDPMNSSSIKISSSGSNILDIVRYEGYSVRAVCKSMLAVSTDSATNVTPNSATLHGKITSVGSWNIDGYGFYYGTDSTDFTSHIQVTDGDGYYSGSITELTPNTLYYYRAYADADDGMVYGEIKSFYTPSGVQAGHGYVDLGLPSGTMWAVCNVGGSNPEELGDLYAWGETETKEIYDWSTYRYCNGSENTLTKYCYNENFGNGSFTDDLTTLEASDDAATANWGNGWRMPTNEEVQELIDNCTMEWTSLNGVTGLLVTGNSNSIFFPTIPNGLEVIYWSSSLNIYEHEPQYAMILTSEVLEQNVVTDTSFIARFYGMPVRAVYKAAPTVSTNFVSNMTISTATLNGSILSGGSSDVTECGFMFGTDSTNLDQNFIIPDISDEFSYQLTDLMAKKTYYYKAYAINSEGTSYGELRSFKVPSGVHNGHEYVDLGLPSCTMWAISNVGASSTEDYGNYYAWGETEVKDNYSSSTNRYHDDELGYIKYNSSDGLTTLESDDDAASVNWGGSWRMPTLSELEELYRYCSHEVVDQNGVHGLRISGNGNSIFLPAAGYYAWGPFNDGNISYYWSSTITDNTDYAVALNSNYENFVFSDLREYGLSVRAVYSACKYVTGITVSDITTESATISWREQGDAENWEMIISEEEIGEAELDLFDNILTLADTSYSAEGLNPGILYHVYVRAACSSDNKSAWKSQTFNTRYLPQIPSTVPYTCDFEDDEENSKWTLSYGGQVNSWYIGTAANNGGSNGMYISNDNGESNQYTNNSSSYAYAFRTIEIPYTADYSISYDWRFVGDGGFSDYLYVFLAHDSLNYNFISGVSQQYFSNCIYVVDYDYSEEAIWNDYSTEKHIEAGTYHLVFNWANDDDGYGDNPPAGIDNISIRMICPEITNVTVSELTQESATIRWTKQDLAGSYEVIVSETELDEDGLANYGSIVTVTDSVYQATGLAQLTTYYVYVRLVCTTSNKSSWISTSFRTLPVPTVVPYNCDFEDVDENDNWVLNNGNQTNKWYIGTAANNGGDNGLYISDDDGETNEYNINGTSYVYAFRDIQVDEAASYQVSYDWRSYGLSHWDAVWAVLIPKSVNTNISAGESNGMVDYYSELPEEWIDVYEEGGAMFSQTEWQTSNKYVNLEDGTYSLVFFWRNSGRGSQPPAAIDNISIVKACLPVENIKTTDITYESATINWDRNFSVTDYKLKISSIAIEEGNLETTTADVFDGIVSDTVKVVSGLIPSTAYYVYVRSVCGPNEYSQWDSTFFKSYQIPVSVPYSCDFENAEENANWSFANEGQNNQWYIGTAANNGGDNGLYISNDNGVSNTYSNTAATFSYAYRDIVVSETGFYHIDFDWRAEGLNFYDMYKLDLLSAFLVPNSLSPIIMGGDANGIFDLYNGTMNATPEGWINLSENGDPLLGQSEWQSNNKELTIEAGTYKLLFYWQNIDKNEIGMEEGGSNPPAAIDNISIWKIACPPVTKIRINDITSNSATISWTERSSATNWKVIISEEAIEDSELNESNAAITVENNPLYVTTGLNPTTKYYVYISAVCSINEVSTWESKTFTTPNLSSTILYYCDFEDEDENENWDLSLTYDSPYSDGEISWEISTQYDNNYEHNLNSPVNYNLRYGDHKCLAYRNITLDSDDYYYKIDFDWRTNSTEPYCAALGVLIPDTTAISEEIYLPSSSITLNECNMFGDNGWQHNTYKSKIAAGDYKLAFIGGVSSVSAVHDAFFEIDNIVIYKSQFSEPILELASATAESASSVTLHGNITDNGGADIIERGFVYGISIENLNMMVQSSDETDEFSATISGFEPGHTYYYRAYAVNNEGTGYGKVNTFIIPSGYHNDHAYVDLGLPSGLLWATMDVGASAFDELGDAYAWGETVTKDEYTDENYTYTDNPETLPSEVDVAAINWSNGWHTPTKDDLQELYDYTTKTIIKRVEGSDYLFCLTGPNGNSIFLRAATGDGYQSIIMSSTLKTDEQDNAYSMVLISVDGISLYGAAVIQRSRSQGYVVRPVRSPELATSSPADEIYNCDFEDDAEYANWTVNNGDQTNHWATGIMSMTSGDKTLFVTNGNDNEYNTGTTSYAYATREIEIEQAGKYQFDFDWRCNGESSYDLLKAFFIPNTATSNFTDGESNGMSNSSNEAPEGWIDISENGTMSSVEDWQHSSKLVSIDAVGLYNLVFFWKNNNSGGSNPPAAVDNIVISRMPPVEVVTQNATRTSTTATVGGELSIEGDVEITQVGFEYGTHDNVLTDTVRMAYAENTFSSQLTDLTPQTNYYYRAFAKYGDDKIAYGDLVKFRTKQNDTDGTEDNPLTIDSAEEWIQFAEAVGTAGGDTINTYKDFEIFDNGDDVYFKLTTDLDFAECGYQGPNMFKGHFNGGGKTITYSNIEQGTAPSAFVYISNATIDSLNILIAESFEIETGASIYGAVGLSASSSSISNCTVSVANAEVVLQSSIYASGIIGVAQDCNITNCTNNLSINVTSSWSFAGGIAVGISGGSVNSCTNNASVAARYGVGGIVGLISGNGANISRCLNTGNINGLISTGGILGVGMEEIEGAVTIDKCMNTGKLSATVAYENYFGGIAGLWQDNSSISISNCANYGSFSELLLATGGIFGVGSVTLSKNIAAPIYESASVSADNNGYNVYSTIAVPDGAQERYPFTETDDFFDEQVGDIRVDSLRLKFAERGTAKETSQIIGTALQSTLSTNWTYADGLYPMPAGIPESTKATLARVPLYLATGETAFGVRSNFTVPTSISGQPVTWTSDNAAISITAGVAIVTRPAEGENDIDVNITAEYDGCTKTFVVRVIAPKHIPVNTGSAVQDTVVTLNGSFDMETVGVTYAKEYGFVYSANSNLADSTKVVSTNLSGLGPYDERNFSASLNGLEEGTRYYYAAFATTGDGTMLGEIKTFRTEGAPDVTMYYPTWRDTISVGLKAKVDMLGDLETYKFYIGLERNSLSEITDGAIYSDEDSTFVVTASGLTPETLYYAVAEAADEYGTTQSDTLSFYTYGHFKDDRDNTDYYTIKIGDQTWMAENLKYVGDEVSLGTTSSETEPYYYYVNGDEANTDTYGYLYNWKAAMNGASSSAANPSGVQGICPNGWHLPSDAEWTELTDYLGGTDNAGAQLAGRAELWNSGTLVNSPYFGTSGFGALPAGAYDGYDGYYYGFGPGAYFWSATEGIIGDVYGRLVYYLNTYLDRSNGDKGNGFSVRCVKGTTIYAYDTVNYCGEEYTFGTQTLTANGDYEETFHLGTDKDSIVYLHLTMYPALTATISEFGSGCFGATDGYVEVTAGGGAGTYTYNWNTPEAQTTARVNNLVAGEYIVTVTDAARCTATASTTLNDGDNEAPQLTGTWPANILGQGNCLADADLNGLYSTTQVQALYEDDSEITVTTNDATTGDNCSWTITRTYTIADACGNSTANTMSVSGSDNTAPVITGTMPTKNVDGCNENLTTIYPAKTTVAELISEATALGGSLSISDNCSSEDELSLSSTESSTGTCPVVVTRTYTITDNCGSSATLSQTINVNVADFTLPGNGSSTVACIDLATEPTPPTVNDNCGTVLSPSDAVEGGTYTDCEGTKTYTYTYTDCAGHTKDWVYTYTIEREDFTMPDDGSSTVACASEITAPTLPAVTDNCGNALTGTLKSGYPTENPSCEGTVVYKYTFTDCAGTAHDWTYTYTIEHTEAPSEVGGPVATTGTAECLAEATAPTTLPVVKDVCGNTLTAPSPVVTDNPDPITCEGSRTYTYVYKDCSNLEFVWTYTYTIVHTTAPEEVGDPVATTGTVECLANATAPTTLPVVKDVCGNALTAPTPVVIDNPDPMTCEGTRTYTYTYKDCANLEYVWTYTYTIEYDDFDMPSDGSSTVSCASEISVPTLPNVTDNCGNALTGVLKSGYPTETPSCEGSVVYKYTFTDCEGNAHDWTYTYTIEYDDFYMPSDGSSTVACASAITAPTLPEVTDNCGNALTGTLKSGYPTETPTCNGDVVYKYTFTDCKGNSHDWTYTYTIERNTAPSLSGTWPNSITGQNNCYENRDISVLFSDDDVAELYTANCGTISVSHSDVAEPTSNCGWTVTRTYTITDGCNEVTNTQSVSGSDEIAPTIGDDDLNRQLTSTNCVFTVPDLTGEVRNIASDNCTANGNLTISQNITAGTEITTATTVIVTVTDQCGNNSTKEIELTLPEALTTSLSANPATIACNGGTTSITNTPNGGTAPYQYFWSNSTNEQNLAGVSAGTYIVTVRDNNGCSVVESIEITQPNALTASLSATEINCHGETANITNTVAGGTTSYTYAWETGETSQNLEGVGGGTYSVTVTDANNCIATATITVNEPAELTSSLSAGEIGCNGGVADITNTVAGGTEPITYAWSNGSNTQGLTGVVAGEYTVTITDAKGCSLVRTAEITQPEILTVTLNAGTIACNGETTTISTNISGGTAPYTYAWNNDAT
ncbi:MAG: hypothetical protein J6W06_08705, partial [Bacteroidales bacterium]|nr:hypothetical protein [Bacteroidales bacterium]